MKNKFNGYLLRKNKLLLKEKASDYFFSEIKKNGVLNTLKKIDGAFNFIFTKGDITYFGTDHFGGYPLFYKKKPKIKIIEDPFAEENTGINDLSLLQILTAGFTLDNRTIYKDITECQPGNLYIIKDNKLLSTLWFNYNCESKNNSTIQDLKEKIDNAFPRFREKINIPLTGGMDTRLIFGKLNEKSENFETFTVGTENNEDVKIAQEISKSFSKKHQHFKYDSKNIDKYFNHKNFIQLVKNGFKGRSLPHELDWIPSNEIEENSIVILGHSGDWISGSYLDKELLEIKKEKKLTRYLFLRNFNKTPFSSFKIFNILKKSLRESIKQLENTSIVAKAENFILLNKHRKYTVNTAQNYRRNKKIVYFPFFQKALMNFFKDLKYEKKINQKLYFKYLKEILFKDNKLNSIRTNRKEFSFNYSEKMSKKIKEWLHKKLVVLDIYRYRKRFQKPTKKFNYICKLINIKDTEKFYSTKITEAFPGFRETIEFLEVQNCTLSVKHLKGMQNFQVNQLSINGILLLKFLPYLLKIEGFNE